ncbi:MAG: 16S rRNA (adenine(1518)-N(6)/adenine(1519)-N(6))-dimethyltransferase RsmA [Pseudomonadota bacterium]
MGLDDLPPLRETIATYGLAAKKGLGQHFLLDLNLTRKIAQLTEAQPGDTILEVGPGPGGLTRALLETGADLIAIERDRRIAPVLEELNDATGRLRAIEADALRADEAKIGLTGDSIIASNLPYNISTELLIKWLTAKPRTWRRMVLMFQKEVGDRILAVPGSKTYGRLSIIAQAASNPRLGFHLPARAFTPPPKVDSSVLIFDDAGRPEHIESLEKVTAAAFSKRRKMLRQSLKCIFSGRLAEVLKQEGVDETARAEDLSVQQYCALARHV